MGLCCQSVVILGVISTCPIAGAENHFLWNDNYPLFTWLGTPESRPGKRTLLLNPQHQAMNFPVPCERYAD